MFYDEENVFLDVYKRMKLKGGWAFNKWAYAFQAIALSIYRKVSSAKYFEPQHAERPRGNLKKFYRENLENLYFEDHLWYKENELWAIALVADKVCILQSF